MTGGGHKVVYIEKSTETRAVKKREAKKIERAESSTRRILVKKEL